MRTILCHQFGPPESLTMEDVPEPNPGPEDVLVNVHAAGVNFPDCLMIQGKYQIQPDMPFAPGGEVAGTIVRCGANVSGWVPGERVFAGIGYGGFAERILTLPGQLRKMPEGMDFTTAAAFSTTYGTSYHALKQRATLRPGENLLVLGAGGGVGLAAVEIGKAMGARVIAAASSEEKLQAARSRGADECVNYADGHLKEKIKALTDQRGADVIYDPVGGELFDQCLRCINWEGRILIIGFASGTIQKAPMNLVLLKGCQIVGVFYGAFASRDPVLQDHNFAELGKLFRAGKLRPLIGATFDLEESARALRHLLERRAIGKVVVTVQR